MNKLTLNNINLETLVTTIQTLRKRDGCPWDQKQTPVSMLKYLRSETEELIEAVQNNDHNNICEEIGDVLYILAMISEMHAEQKIFHLSDAINGINDKLIRRHPHVFEGQPYKDEEQLRVQWETIKAEEKKKNSL